VPGAREAVTGPVDVGAALAWRDFMVSDHTDAGAAGRLADRDAVEQLLAAVPATA
jgi:hypothetical protein